MLVFLLCCPPTSYPSTLQTLHPAGLRVNITTPTPTNSSESSPVCVSTVTYPFLLTGFLYFTVSSKRAGLRPFFFLIVTSTPARAGQSRHTSSEHEEMNASRTLHILHVTTLSLTLHTPVPFSQAHLPSSPPSQGGYRGSGFGRELWVKGS